MNSTESQQVSLAYDALPASLLSSLGVAGLLILTLWPVVAAERLLAWGGLMAAVVGLRFAIFFGYRRFGRGGAGSRRWRDRFVLSGAAGGLAWGIAGVALFPAGHPEYQMVLVLILTGISFGAVTNHSYLFSAPLLFVPLALLPLTARLALESHALARLVVLLLLLYLFFILASARRISETTRSNISTRLQGMHQQELLRESEERYRSIFTQAPLGLMHFDAEGVILECNERFVSILGSTRKALLGWDMRQRLENPEMRQALESALHGDTGFYEGIYRSLTGSRTVPVRVYFRAIRAHDGESLGGLAIVEDYGEQYRAAEELRHAKEEAERANQTKSAFLTNMGHEFRTPLNAIINFSEVALRDAQGPQERHRAAEILKAGRNLLAIVEDIFDLASLDVGRMRVCPVPLQLSPLLEEIYGFFETEADRKGLSYRLELAPGLPDGISIDRARLRQILLKLIGNAIKFTDRGSVVLHAGLWEKPLPEPERVHLSFWVEDTGPGIPEAEQRHLFEPFWQEQHSDNRKHGGIGGGLALCRGLAAMLGGEIRVESRQGVGSRFELMLRGIPVVGRAEIGADGADVSPTDIPSADAAPFAGQLLDDARRTELHQRIGQELMPEWLTAERTKALHRIARFGEQVASIGTEFGVPAMEQYGQGLLDSVEQIDIVRLTDFLDIFPEMVERITGRCLSEPSSISPLR